MRTATYDKFPCIKLKHMSHQAFSGEDAILAQLKKHLSTDTKKKVVVCIDCYQGVNQEKLCTTLKALNPVKFIDISCSNYSESVIDAMLEKNITDDRVFGIMSHHKIEDFFDPTSLHSIREEIVSIGEGIVIVYGIGASLIKDYDILIYADMPRWELQLRMRRNEVANWCSSNFTEEFLRKYKRSFFIDWRVLDQHKRSLFHCMDYLLDTTNPDVPKMITGEVHQKGLAQAATQPFRVVPFFDPGVWGGQWMKEVCALDSSKENYAWCFDCVPEENSLLFDLDGMTFELPSINLVLSHPKVLLGDKVYARFGAEFPIRFDFLDTMDGQNLSLQVHPVTDYIQRTFGMHYTQDESYYILDCKEDATVYLGVKDSISSKEMLQDLKESSTTDKEFDADKYINCFPAKKHDHFLIPSGTIHCSGKNAMVLEISATPYIFTFKLWDWGRLGLDGKPRPIHLEHGANVINWDRTTDFVKNELVNHIDIIHEDNHQKEERTGLHELEFIETRRHWFSESVHHITNGSVNVLNLVEGDEAVITSPTNAFEPFIVHYAETFIIPACVKEYMISPTDESKGQMLATIKAYVRL